MRRSAKDLGLFCFTLLVPGCASMGHSLDREHAREYASLGVAEFVKARFADQQKSPLDRLTQKTLGVSTTPAFAPDVPGPVGLREDGRSVAYNASFTSMNMLQLTRPRRDLESYCAAQSGVLSVDASARGNYVRDHFEEGTRRRMLTARPPSEHGRHVHIGPKNGQPQYPGFDRADGESAYQRAAQSGSFGRFSCTAQSGKRWTVDVLPVAYMANDPYNSLIPHELLLLIDPTPSSAEATSNASSPPLADVQSEAAPDAMRPSSEAPPSPPSTQSAQDLDAVRAALAQARAQQGAVSPPPPATAAP
jgi:hypothetical protein